MLEEKKMRKHQKHLNMVKEITYQLIEYALKVKSILFIYFHLDL